MNNEKVLFSDESEKEEKLLEINEQIEQAAKDYVPSSKTDSSAQIPSSVKKVKFSVKFKVTIMTTLLVAVVTLVISLYLLRNIKSNLLNEMRLKAKLFTTNLAKGLSEIMDDDTSRHEIIQKNKQTLKDIVNINVINLNNELIDTTEEKKYQRIIQSKFDENIKKIKIKIDSGIITILKKRSFYEKTYNIQGEERIYCIAPVKLVNSYLGYIKIDFTQKHINEKISMVQFQIIIFIVSALIIGIILSYILSSHIIKPIYKLSQGVQIIGNGNLNHKIKLKTQDELKYLADEFNNMSVKLIQAQKSLVEKERYEEQLQIAKGIQENLLPEKFPNLDEIEMSSYYKAARGVGGDYYDIIYQKNQNKINSIIADVSGKGVPAALVMVMIRTVLHSTLKFIKTANEAMEYINQGVTGKLTGDKFATMFYFSYDLQTGQLEYANAAHSPLIIYKNRTKSILELDTEGVPIGIEMNSHFGVNTTILEEGDIIVTFTDGITEAMNKQNELFKPSRLKEIVINNSTLSAEELKNKIISKIDEFVGNSPQHDDMTLVVFKIKKVIQKTGKKDPQENTTDQLKSEIFNPADHNSLLI